MCQQYEISKLMEKLKKKLVDIKKSYFREIAFHRYMFKSTIFRKKCLWTKQFFFYYIFGIFGFLDFQKNNYSNSKIIPYYHYLCQIQITYRIDTLFVPIGSFF